MTATRSAPRRVIIDTDPGVDDAMAILFACASHEVRVEGLTTTFGNTDTDLTTANALRLVELAGQPEIPVARGAENPLVRRDTPRGWRVHGRNGLGEAEVPPPSGSPDPRRAARFIVETVTANPGEITLVTLGPLTNLALAVSLEPRLAGLVREVVVMGGAANAIGNASPVAEANVWYDPEAAHIVLHAGWPVTMVGLDVTRRCVMTPAYLDRLYAAGNRFTDFIRAIVPYYLRFYRTVHRVDGVQAHDPAALAYVVDPSLFETRPAYVDVEYQSPRYSGLTVADWNGHSGREPNVNVCLDVDSERLLELFRQRMVGGGGGSSEA